MITLKQEQSQGKYYFRMIQRLVLVTLLISLSVNANAQFWTALWNTGQKANIISYYVSPSGSNLNDGSSLESPFLTIQKAADVARSGDVVEIAAGVYRETVTLSSSGTLNEEIVFRAAEGENVELTAMDELSTWTNHSGNIWYATFDDAVMPRYNLVVMDDGEFLSEATWSATTTNVNRLLNSDYTPYESYTSTSITAVALSGFTDGELVGSEIWLRINQWTLIQRTITSNVGNVISWAEPLGFTGAPFEFILLNNLDFLNTSAGWYLDESANRLYVRLSSGDDPHTHTVEARNRRNCIDLNRNDYVNIEGLNIVGGEILVDSCDYTVINSNKFIFNDWSFGYVNDESIQIMMEFSGSGNRFINNEVEGVCQRFINLSGNTNTILNNYFHDCGYRDRYGAAMSIDGSSTDLVAYNTFKNFASSVITGGPVYRSEFAYNHIFNFTTLSDDVGAFGFANNAYGASIVHHNVMHDSPLEQTTGIYMDNFCSNIVVYNNITYGTAWGIRLNYPQFTLLAYNNTHYNKSGIYGNSATGDYSSIGTRIFNNTYQSIDAVFINNLQSIGGNLHTLVDEDIIWTDAENGDFTIPAGSPAINYGENLAGLSQTPGALEYGEAMWEYGHDFNTPPTYAYSWVPKPFMNYIENESFESGTEGWSESGTPSTFYAQAWQYKDNALGKAGLYTLKLKPGDAVTQSINGLLPSTSYEASTYARIVGYDAEIWGSKSGSSGTFDVNYAGGIRGIAGLDNGEYVWWNAIDFGTNLYNRIELTVTNGSVINVEVRLDAIDGPIIASGELTYTTSNTWNFAHFDFGSYSGERPVYLKFISAGATSDRIGNIRFLNTATTERAVISELGGATANIGSAYWSDKGVIEFTTGSSQTTTELTIRKTGGELDAYVDIVQLVEKEVIAVPTRNVTFYAGDKFTSTEEEVGIGLSNLNNPNVATSLKIPYGYRVTCYSETNGGGNSRVFESDVPYLWNFSFEGGAGMDNAISSVLVELR